MSFKIVQTIEDGQTCLSIVPSSWESAGILYWPNNKALARKLQKQSNSVPDKNKWHKMVCIKKRQFSTHAEAETELEKMEAVDDTDLEETMALEEAVQNKRKRISSISQVPDFNNLVPTDIIQHVSFNCFYNTNKTMC